MLLTIVGAVVAVLAVLASLLYWWFVKDYGKWEALGVPSIEPEFFYGNVKKLYTQESASVPMIMDFYKKLKGTVI